MDINKEQSIQEEIPPKKSNKHFIFVTTLVILLILPVIVFVVSSKKLTESRTRASESNVQSVTTDLLSSVNQQPERSQVNRTILDKAVQRKNLMLEEAKTNPKQFLTDVMDPSLRDILPDYLKPYIEQKSTISGTLSILHGDDFKNKKEFRNAYIINNNSIYNLNLVASLDEKYETGDTISTNNSFVLDDQIVSDNSISNNLTIQSNKKTPKTVANIAVVPIVFNDNSKYKVISKNTLQKKYFGDGNDSLKAFINKASYGTMGVKGQVMGDNYATINFSCDVDVFTKKTDRIADYYRRQDFTYISFIFPYGTSCDWSGYGQIGGDQTWISTTPSDFLGAVSHEFGHNLGLNHANLWKCDSSSNCQSEEYGDDADSMGLYVANYNAPHENALGFISSSDIFNVTGSGTYTIANLESYSGKRAIKIPLGTSSNSYWLEYRNGAKDDQGLNKYFTTGVLIHTWDGIIGHQTNLINSIDSVLSDGQTFHGIYDISIKLVSRTNNSAMIKITIPK